MAFIISDATDLTQIYQNLKGMISFQLKVLNLYYSHWGIPVIHPNKLVEFEILSSIE